MSFIAKVFKKVFSIFTPEPVQPRLPPPPPPPPPPVVAPVARAEPEPAAETATTEAKDRKKKLRRTTSTGGKQNVFTSPLGISDPANTRQKRLLGA